MGKLLTRLPDSRLHNCKRFGHLQEVRAAEKLKSSHRPDGKSADALALILALHNWECFGQLQMVRAAETFKSSHRPNGIYTCFALLLAGRRCVHRRWHGELLIVHHHGQQSWRCACSHSKVPIAPMGKMLTRLLGLTLAQLRPTLLSTSECTCRRGP